MSAAYARSIMMAGARMNTRGKHTAGVVQRNGARAAPEVDSGVLVYRNPSIVSYEATSFAFELDVLPCYRSVPRIRLDISVEATLTADKVVFNEFAEPPHTWFRGALLPCPDRKTVATEHKVDMRYMSFAPPMAEARWAIGVSPAWQATASFISGGVLLVRVNMGHYYAMTEVHSLKVVLSKPADTAKLYTRWTGLRLCSSAPGPVVVAPPPSPVSSAPPAPPSTEVISISDSESEDDDDEKTLDLERCTEPMYEYLKASDEDSRETIEAAVKSSLDPEATYQRVVEEAGLSEFLGPMDLSCIDEYRAEAKAEQEQEQETESSEDDDDKEWDWVNTVARRGKRLRCVAEEKREEESRPTKKPRLAPRFALLRDTMGRRRAAFYLRKSRPLAPGVAAALAEEERLDRLAMYDDHAPPSALVPCRFGSASGSILGDVMLRSPATGGALPTSGRERRIH